MLNPFRVVTNFITTTLTVLILGLTHITAFRAGLAVTQNPVSAQIAQWLGVISPMQTCSRQEGQSEDAPWWSNLPYLSDRHEGGERQ